MNRIDLLWFAQPPSVKLLLIALFSVVTIAVVRFVRLARRLSRYSRKGILPANIVTAETDPDLLAASALASRALCKPALEKSAHSEPSAERVNTEQALYVLRVAESRFLYLWERCYIDVESTRRASWLTFLVSFVIVAAGASPIYDGYHNNSKLTGSYCLFLTAEQLVVTLALGLSLSAMLYLGSSFFERKLADREVCWKYFCSRLKIELSRE